MNGPKFTHQVVEAIRTAKILEITDFGPQDPSEDFAYFAQKRPVHFYTSAATLLTVKFTHITVLIF